MSWVNGCFHCVSVATYCDEKDGESEHIVGGRGGKGGKGECTLHVMGTFVTQRGSVSFAVISNIICHLNLMADCHATATMKTSRDNQLLMKCLYLLVILNRKLNTSR